MASARILPNWAEELRRRYLRNEASIFVIHGNVYDAVVHEGKMQALTDFLTGVLLRESKDTIVVYNLATGVRFAKRARNVPGADEAIADAPREKVLLALEHLVTAGSKTAAIIEYAETLAPAGDTSFQADADRASVVTLHRWSFLPEIEKGDNIVILITDNLSDLSQKLVSNPKVGVVEVPMPDLESRRATARIADAKLSDADVDHYAEVTAGLKAIQIASILAPPPPSEEDRADREAFIATLLGGGQDVVERAKKLAVLTAGMMRDEIRKLLAPGAGAPAASPSDASASALQTCSLAPSSDVQQRHTFLHGTPRDREEVLAIWFRKPSVAFSQVCSDRQSRAVQLIRQKVVAARQFARERTDRVGKSDRLLVDLEFLKGEGH